MVPFYFSLQFLITIITFSVSISIVHVLTVEIEDLGDRFFAEKIKSIPAITDAIDRIKNHIIKFSIKFDIFIFPF
jgi:demethoxyubiquinone hydroxylase (CLK1/Coq7/Cat5 family)